jgi:undecaprenyl-diphosphatase
MLSSIYQSDWYWVHLINQQWINPFLDTAMAAMSSYELFRIPLAVVILILIGFGRFRERAFLALMFFCILLGDGVIMNGVKHATDRPRPREAREGVRVVTLEHVEFSDPAPGTRQHGHSFPSSHVGNNVALALVATAFYGAWAWPLWIWAAAMGYSRIYVGAHFPSDVVGGWIIALIYTALIIKVGEWAWRKYAPRFAPKLYERHPSLIDRDAKKSSAGAARL